MEVVEVAPGVHHARAKHVSWVLVTEGEAVTLVDTGYPGDRAAVLESLRHIGRSPTDVESVVLTHGHPDHIGSAEHLRTSYGIPVWAHELEAAWEYARTTKRRVSIEYAMMRDINDQAWRADLLGEVLTSYGDWGWVHVNLIPLNPTPGSKWTASRRSDEREFVRRLEAKGVPTTVRDTRGSEIDGACGQLAAVDS
jgi:glyoxylase-like metal-dependent hydrolase (beta-lactamase superfamily II)